MDLELYRGQLKLAEKSLAQDEILAPLIERFGPCGLAPDTERTPFEALIRAVVYQQLHGKAAETIYRRLLTETAPTGAPTPEQLLLVSDEALQRAGVSRQKAAAIRDIAARTAAGELPRDRQEISALSDEVIIARLSEARGVGRWTVEMLLIFTLGRLDVWPVDDYGVRVGYCKAANRVEQPKPKELKLIGERWKPWRSVAAWYFWQLANQR